MNPIDATRVATLLAVSGREMFGSAGAQLVRSLGGTRQAIALLCGVLLAWITLTTAIADISLRRQDL